MRMNVRYDIASYSARFALLPALSALLCTAGPQAIYHTPFPLLVRAHTLVHGVDRETKMLLYPF